MMRVKGIIGMFGIATKLIQPYMNVTIFHSDFRLKLNACNFPAVSLHIRSRPEQLIAVWTGVAYTRPKIRHYVHIDTILTFDT